MQQAIRTPFGVSVFGSALIRVAPDVASLHLGVSRVEKQPRNAFASVREATRMVRDFLEREGIGDVGASRVSLEEKRKYVNGEHRFAGYEARVGFHIVLDDPDRVEQTLVGAVDAGVNEITSVSFQTRKLREIRAQARRQAIEAARNKAEICCEAAGVRLGAVVHIEDVDPEAVSRGYEGHLREESGTQEMEEVKAIDPGAITVAAAIRVGYAIEPG